MLKNMDTLSAVGFLIAFFAVIIGMQLEGGHIESLVNLPALVIVLGGSLGAVLLETPKKTVRRAFDIIKWVLFPPNVVIEKKIADAVVWSKIARKEGMLGLENVIQGMDCAFTKRAIQLLIDGNDSSDIRSILMTELESKELDDIKAAGFFESFGGYCPTLGILGAVLGLIHVMSNLQDPGTLGTGIAVAFVATVYGVGLSNVVFIPVSKRLKNIIMLESLGREMVIEAVVSINNGESTALIETKLQGFLG